MGSLHRVSARHWATHLLLICSLLFAAPVTALDWKTVEEKEITLFAPGQRSWESVLTQSEHPGAKQFRKGKTCRGCHEDEETYLGKGIVSGKNKQLEAEPIAGMRPWIPLSVKIAHDGRRLYVRLEWPQSTENIARKLEPETEAMAALVFGDRRTTEALRGGCWGACHDDMASMPSAEGSQGVTKYLAASRTKMTRKGGGDALQSRDKLAELLGNGVFYEYWRARLGRGSAAISSDGYILEKRHENSATNVQAEGGFADGKWSVVFSRDLTLGAVEHKDFVPGTTYLIGFAVHDAFAAGRYHHVSFEHTLVLDEGRADFVVKKH